MLDDYLAWGGLPLVVLEPDEREKERYLKTLCDKLFLKDIKERHHLNDDYVAGKVMDVLSSAVGSLTNPNKLVKTLGSQMAVNTTNRTPNRGDARLQASNRGRGRHRSRRYHPVPFG